MPKEVILGIESSCDDTAAAVVTADGTVLSSEVATQTHIHSEFGGVYPEFASRAHISSIIPTVERVMRASAVFPPNLRAIAVTRGPGLIGPLVVGLNTAAGLALGWGIPVIGVNHLRGHLRSADLEQSRVNFPAIVLLVSGGHTFLAFMESFHRIELLGATRDDSVGEAYDKVGRMLGLGYPAGAAVDRLATAGQPTIRLPRPMIGEGFEFSFSGLKSAVARSLEKASRPKAEDVAASFVEAAMEILLSKCRRALMNRSPRSLVVVGGVAASPQLRARAKELCDGLGVELCLPPLRWSTDNAAMIALAGWDYLEANRLPRPLPETELRITEY